jgi:hypothetical protein
VKTAQRSARHRRTTLRTRTSSQKSPRKGVGVSVAASRVKARRAAPDGAAVADPVQADHSEFARILPGKLSAYSRAATILMAKSGEMAQQITRFVSYETMIAAEAGTRVARCRDLDAALTVQRQFTMAWYFRALSQNIAVAGQMMLAVEAVLAPVQSVATSSSKRFS